MKHRHQILGSGLLALTAVLATVPAQAGDDCDAPVSRWQSREAVRQMAAQKGWEVQRLKIDDGCYEIRGTDAEGRGFKAKIDPETLEVVKLKQRDRKDQRADRKRERERTRDPGESRDGLAPATPAASPLFTPGTAPRGQIE
ncbi:MAG TPA: PepSY domain-containing protein [Ottowia sp.]|uniref:PepSY domain-containing protein n=1 Tax=Ottowia sp. TaxID=1898956 RepID=UPI002BD56B34|nr:PepSY domain-containing protein [Ottowia sp.]HMN21383.1 PepSY domain-containing protein [Ottowia sp.]